MLVGVLDIVEVALLLGVLVIVEVALLLAVLVTVEVALLLGVDVAVLVSAEVRLCKAVVVKLMRVDMVWLLVGVVLLACGNVSVSLFSAVVSGKVVLTSPPGIEGETVVFFHSELMVLLMVVRRVVVMVVLSGASISDELVALRKPLASGVPSLMGVSLS